MHVTCSRVLSAMRIPGRAAAAAHARRRAVFTAAVTRVSGRLPPAAISFSARQQVGTDATLRGDKISGLRIYFPMSLLIEQLTG